MSYEIPQQLEYKEKIIFGLTFKQLAYLFIFSALILITFFRTNLNSGIRILFTINFTALASGFMFLNLDQHIKVWYLWFKLRNIDSQKKKDNFIYVKEIKNNLIYTKDKKIAILKIEPINFSIKPNNSKEALTLIFQKFLNSLDFPIQILMNTEALNLQDYFKEMDRKIIQNKDFEFLFKKYKEHLNSLTSQNNVLNRNFYLIIPEKSDIEIQVQICQGKLDALDLKSSRLKDNELEKLISQFFDGKIEEFRNKPHFLKINNTFNRIIYAHGYPRSVESGFLDRIVSSLGDFDLSLHIEPFDIESTMLILNKELQKQRADLYSAKIKGIQNTSLEIKYEDTESVLKNLQKGKEKLYNVSLYINCRAKSKEDLDLLTKRIEAELNSLLIIPKEPSFRMAQGFQSCAPLANNALKISRNITTEALSAFFPFTSSFLQADKTGVWLGLNKNNIPLIKDIFKLSNPNGICLASSGAGKSYMAKLLISRYLLNGVKVMVIDPQGEYKNLVERFKGQRIDLSRTSKTIINPLDLMGHDYHEKRLALMDLMPIMLGELSEPQKAFMDRALTKAYELNGITEDPDSWNNKPPILEDVVKILENMEKRAITLERSTIRSLVNRLRMYTDGVFSFLNKHTNINFDNKFVCFDIGSMPKQVKPVIMFLVLDYVYMKMKRDLERKLLVIDEAWSLLGRTEDASYIFEIVKTCRKFNLALFLINQEVEGMLESEAGKSVLANTSYTLLMRQKPAVIKDIEETFFLSSSERAHLLTANVGEGILLMDDEHSEIKIVASEEEHKLITTNPDEILEQKSNKKEQIKSEKKVLERPSLEAEKPLVKINVDENVRLYKHKDLSLDDVKYLIKKGFKEINQISIKNKKKERYLIKLRHNESESHCFMSYDIANYLKGFTDKVTLFDTVKPDITFEINEKKYAIEVETGKVLTKDRKKFIEKVNSLNKNYGNNWFFVLTNRKFYGKYSKYGQTFTKKSLENQLNKILKKNEKR